MGVEPIDGVRLRIVINALKDVARTGNPMVFPLALFLRRHQQNIFQPGEVLLARSMSNRRDEHIPILGGLLPFVKELSPREFSALVTDIKAQGPSLEILVDGFKAGDFGETAERLKAIRQISTEYAGITGIANSLRTRGSLGRRVIGAPFRSIGRNMRRIRYDLASPKNKALMEQGLKGGPGSGNFGHTGRIGGGSNPTIPHGGVFTGIRTTIPGLLGRGR